MLGRAGIVPTFLGGQALAWSAWLVAAIMVLNTLTNLSGRHPVERWGMSAIALATALLVAYVAYASPYIG